MAQRLTAAAPGGSDYRAMNIEVGFYSQPRYVFKIDRTAYFPQPKVHGALVDFALRSPAARHPLPISDADFLKMARPQPTDNAAARALCVVETSRCGVEGV